MNRLDMIIQAYFSESVAKGQVPGEKRETCFWIEFGTVFCVFPATTRYFLCKSFASPNAMPHPEDKAANMLLRLFNYGRKLHWPQDDIVMRSPI